MSRVRMEEATSSTPSQVLMMAAMMAAMNSPASTSGMYWMARVVVTASGLWTTKPSMVRAVMAAK